jgi:hypothetical protein
MADIMAFVTVLLPADVGRPDRVRRTGARRGRYQWVRARLASIDHDELRELIVNAWRMTVPKKVWQEYSDSQQ